MNLFDQIVKMQKQDSQIRQSAYDNLFNADHRNAILTDYGFTEAQRLTVGELQEGFYDL